MCITYQEQTSCLRATLPLSTARAGHATLTRYDERRQTLEYRLQRMASLQPSRGRLWRAAALDLQGHIKSGKVQCSLALFANLQQLRGKLQRCVIYWNTWESRLTGRGTRKPSNPLPLFLTFSAEEKWWTNYASSEAPASDKPWGTVRRSQAIPSSNKYLKLFAMLSATC